MTIKEINTPCGFQIILFSDENGVGISTYMQGVAVNITNSAYRLSPEGARMLAEGLVEVVESPNISARI